LSKQTVTTNKAAPPGGPYSQAVIAGDLVYCAGATPTRPDGTRVEGTFEEQARATFENLRAVAEAARASLEDAVRAACISATSVTSPR
jgi:2-iminobutanoate/2-iminopropanoate deaminase